ncbi:hypothetical protein BJ165DRAFT_1486974 [Panaeolus papilionaceus]|nr:hypothetical protein BJ165DRAFT_1486974 [Panaeolus papilionaceus]
MQIVHDHIKSLKKYNTLLPDDKIDPGDPSAPLLYQELLDRITNIQQVKKFLQQERMDLIMKPDPLLELDVCSRLLEVKEDLSKFIGQLIAFGDPPSGFEGVPEQCMYRDLLHTNPDHVREETLTHQLDLVEKDLAEHVTTLLERGIPPEGCEKALEHTLGPSPTLDEDLPFSSQPSSSDPVPNVPNPGTSSRTSFKGRLKRGFQSFKDKFRPPSLHEGCH